MYLIAPAILGQTSSTAASENANAFWSTTFGSTVKILLASTAILLLLAAIFKAAGKFTSGKITDGFKIIGGALIAAVFLFRPETLTDLVNVAADVFEALFGSGQNLVNQGTERG